MRFTRVATATEDELKRAVLGEIDALLPGCRVLASEIEIPDAGVIDRLAAGPDGSLAIVTFSTEVDCGALSRSLAQLEWVMRNLSIMRAMGLRDLFDPSSPPCCVLVGERVAASALQLAGWLPRPRISLFTAGFLMVGESRGVLMEPIAPQKAPADSMDRDDPLLALPEGEARSMGRRILEELRYETGGVPIGVRPVQGGLLFERDGAPAAILAYGTEGVSFFRLDPSPAGRIASGMAGDGACRLAVAEILRRSEPPAAPPAKLMPERIEMQAPEIPLRTSPSSAALTPEETAEFERLSASPRGSRMGSERMGLERAGSERRRSALDLPTSHVQRIRVVEN